MGRKHLIINSTSVTDTKTPLVEETTLRYLAKRLNFVKWRLHRTMGNPVLVRRRKP